MSFSTNVLGANLLLLVGAAIALAVAVLLSARRLLKMRAHLKQRALVDVDAVQPLVFSLDSLGRYPANESPEQATISPATAALIEAQRKIPSAPPVPERKLFLSWAAVQRAVKSGAVTEERLDQCLFCTSVGELNLAEEFDAGWFDRLHPAFARAAKEGRLICNQDSERYNATAIWEVNLLLQRNGVAPLSCVDQMGTLEQIPMYSCVPSVSDGSMEVLWAAHPLRGDWRRCWGRSLEAIDEAFAELADEPERPSANWMQELNQPLIDEARRKFEKPQADDAYFTPGGDLPEGYGKAEGDGESEDPADFWKKGRPHE